MDAFVDPLMSLQEDDEIGVEAPTGYGKSTGVYKIIGSCAAHFRKTLFVFPTRIAKNQICREKISHVVACTAKQAIRHLIRSYNDFYTVVIDEAHHPCREYHTIFKILKTFKTVENKKMRLICLSATLDRERLNTFFPKMTYVEVPPLNTAFTIDIQYADINCSPFYPNFMSIASGIEARLRVATENKILVFMATHDNCEKMKRQILHTMRGYKIVTLHGGMDEEEIEETKNMMCEGGSRYVCFATNMVESAVTFADVDLVIDSGICCRLRGNSLKLEYCDRVSMIQRAGRTGRTCDGKVYRVMKQDFFQLLPLQSYQQHDFDAIVLQLLNLGVCPHRFLGEEADPSIRRFLRLGIMGDRPLLVFLEECGLGISSGLEYYRMVNKKDMDEMTFLCLLLCVSIHNYYEMKKGGTQIIYNSGNMWKLQKKIANEFCFDDDPLLSLVNILVSVFVFSKNAKDTAAEFSFNFKTLRSIWSCFKSLFYKNFWGRDMNYACDLFSKYEMPKDPIRLFYFTSPYSRIYMTKNAFREYDEPVYFRDFVSSVPLSTDHNCKISLVNNEYSDLTESYDHVLLWISPPECFVDRKLYAAGLRKALAHRKEKKKNRLEFEKSLVEIREEVAYRPGFYRIGEEIDALVKELVTAP